MSIKRVQFNKKQLEAYEKAIDQDNGIYEIGFGGAKGGGKTFWLCVTILGMAIDHPDTVYMICRKEFSALKDSTLTEFNMILNKFGYIEGQHYTWESRQQNSDFVLKNKSRIMFRHMKADASGESARFGSVNVTSVGIDEASETELSMKKTLIDRIGRHNKGLDGNGNKVKAMLMVTFNPDQTSWVDDYYEPYRPLPKGVIFIKSTIEDNIDNLSPETVQRYRSWEHTDPAHYKRFILGLRDYDTAEDVLFPAVTLGQSIKPIKPDHNEKFFMGVDIAFRRDKLVMAILNGPGGDTHMNLIEIKAIKGHAEMSPEQVIRHIKTFQNKYKIRNEQVSIDSDGLGLAISGSEQMKGCITFNATKPPYNPEKNKPLQTEQPELPRNWKAQVYGRLSDMMRTGRFLINSDPSMITPDDMSSLREELLKYKNISVDNGKAFDITPKKDIKAVLGRSPDYSDAVAYGMHFTVQYVGESQPILPYDVGISERPAPVPEHNTERLLIS